MEERKTAAVVLGIFVLIALGLIIILRQKQHHQAQALFATTKTISFKTCTIRYKYWNKGLMGDIERAAQNELALCLCDSYRQQRDTAVANRIMRIYKRYGNHYGPDSLSLYNSVDSLIKNRNRVLDTLVLAD
ncbi:hypothetical protein [Mucilaginibacter paludis]|uniref:Uncharacterized protein n=1 Tax=Mucilaginibacter paludis DSM 18603 TaxID=714943 RepID=H1YAZ7_9SPHI|nr:hypothetical protein [Mucilaginibacter paludis]EHQ30030.1 hypothetical protein Mucpa_5970 [Mucilaginibacter paludis DSM 18603]